MRARGVIGDIEHLGITSKKSDSSKVDLEESKKQLIVSLNALLHEVKKFEEELKFEMRKVSSINRESVLNECVSKPIITLDSLKNKLSNLDYLRWYIASNQK